jgi:hypothetical protein|uniref:Thioredoxin-like fold domain-containing protein n=1 Tax=candidate division CPR3 bacterium TaxID=2268181 RepID=A0A7C5URJ7_UNCC3
MKSIEIYVKNEKLVIPLNSVKPNYSMLSSKWDIIPWNVLPEFSYTISILPEEDRKALEIAQKVAEKTGAKLKVRDVNYFEGKFFALLKGVKKTPTVIVGNKKIEKIDEETLLSYLFELEPKQCSDSS